MDKIKLAVPTLIMSVGVSASGKTTFFKELVKLVYDTFLIDKDTINNAFLLKPVINDGSIESYRFSEQVIPKDSNYYHKNVKLQSYHALLKIAKDNLEVGKHPILDAPYVKELRRGYLQEVVNPFFKEINYQTKVIFCYADEEVIRQRMKERNSERDRAKSSDRLAILLTLTPLAGANSYSVMTGPGRT